eukprot:Pompholyxophrys_sp_v1_NODE_1_length_32789_cov_6.460653.p17 type:complete len:243 gc:universal NODE_1_length_32789_cov_6.460653:18057-18785(+)
MGCRKIQLPNGVTGNYRGDLGTGLSPIEQLGGYRSDRSMPYYDNYNFDQIGGYGMNFRLKKEVNPKRNRFERTFTQVFADGSTEGKYTGFDYSKHPADGHYQMQGTAWLSAVKKAYRQACMDFREIIRLSRVMEDFGLEDLDQAEDKYNSLSKGEKARYQEESAQIKCEPMEIMLRETTPGNNKMDFTYRQKKYYVASEPIKPRTVSPSRGSSPRTYRFLPKVYPMRLKETIEEFRERKGLN